MTQCEMSYLTELGHPKPVDQSWLDRCECFADALRLSFELRRVRYTQSEFAALIGWDGAQVSRFMNKKTGRGKANPDPDLWERWMAVTGNTLPAQYLAKRLERWNVEETPEQKIARLERENRQLRESNQCA